MSILNKAKKPKKSSEIMLFNDEVFYIDWKFTKFHDLFILWFTNNNNTVLTNLSRAVYVFCYENISALIVLQKYIFYLSIDWLIHRNFYTQQP